MEANRKRFAYRLFLGLLLFFVILAADQVTKQMVLLMMQVGESVPVLPFLNITFIWNHGISFGWFADMGSFDAKFWIIVVSIVIVLFLFYWLFHAGSIWLSMGLGLMIGGAVGNIIDRIGYGAVVDFIHFFWGSYSWYVFMLQILA